MTSKAKSKTNDWNVDENRICRDCGVKVEEDWHLCPYNYMGTNSYGKKPKW